MANHPSVAQELQDMVIDHNYADSIALANAAQVSHAWHTRSHHHLFSRLVVRSIACRVRHVEIAANGEFKHTTFIPPRELSFTFKDAFDIIPSSFDAHVKILVLAAAPTHKRFEYSAQGTELMRPDLTPCDVVRFLNRFPNLHSLIIEDVEWEDCGGPYTKCDCLCNVAKRPLQTLALRRIHHDFVSSSAMLIMQAASTIEDLVLEGLKYEDSATPAYPYVPTRGLTYGISSQPWKFVLPPLGTNTLTRLNMSSMTWVDLDFVRAVVNDHAESLEEITFSVWWSADRQDVWDAIGIAACPKLRSCTVSFALGLGSGERSCAAQEMTSRILEQLPITMQTVKLSFEAVNDDVARAFCLLSPQYWARAGNALGGLPNLRRVCIEVRVPVSRSARSLRRTDELHKAVLDLLGLFVGAEVVVETIIVNEAFRPEAYEQPTDVDGW